jgi:hypothetical protein
MNRTTIKALFLLALIAFPISKVIAGIAITPAFIRLSETIQDKKIQHSGYCNQSII